MQLNHKSPIVPQATLFVGGTRSGKSTLALRYAESLGEKGLYIATAPALNSEHMDEETKERVLAHQAERGAHWQTWEADTIDLLHAPLQNAHIVLLDCLTLWLSNALEQASQHSDMHAYMDSAMQRLEHFISHCPLPLVIVSSEVGQGIVPMSALARKFRDLHGTLNQRVARLCPRVLFVSCGLALALKGDVPAALQ